MIKDERSKHSTVVSFNFTVDHDGAVPTEEECLASFQDAMDEFGLDRPEFEITDIREDHDA